MNDRLEDLIDKIVKYIDEDTFTEEFNSKTSPLDEENLEANRDGLRDLLEPLLDDSDLLSSLYKAGVENFEGYELALEVYGRPIYE